VVGADVSEGDGRTILGDKQMADFTKWVGKVCPSCTFLSKDAPAQCLLQVNSTAAFKFIISSVPLTGMWGGPNGQIDTWMGAARERRALKELLQFVPNVVFITGDRHEFAAVEHIGAKPVYEFSVRYIALLCNLTSR
jgi:alkaline phosphatase D